jgi:hypothetical protein
VCVMRFASSKRRNSLTRIVFVLTAAAPKAFRSVTRQRTIRDTVLIFGRKTLTNTIEFVRWNLSNVD